MRLWKKDRKQENKKNDRVSKGLAERRARVEKKLITNKKAEVGGN